MQLNTVESITFQLIVARMHTLCIYKYYRHDSIQIWQYELQFSTYWQDVLYTQRITWLHNPISIKLASQHEKRLRATEHPIRVRPQLISQFNNSTVTTLCCLHICASNKCEDPAAAMCPWSMGVRLQVRSVLSRSSTSWNWRSVSRWPTLTMVMASCLQRVYSFSSILMLSWLVASSNTTTTSHTG